MFVLHFSDRHIVECQPHVTGRLFDGQLINIQSSAAAAATDGLPTNPTVFQQSHEQHSQSRHAIQSARTHAGRHGRLSRSPLTNATGPQSSWPPVTVGIVRFDGGSGCGIIGGRNTNRIGRRHTVAQQTRQPILCGTSRCSWQCHTAVTTIGTQSGRSSSFGAGQRAHGNGGGHILSSAVTD